MSKPGPLFPKLTRRRLVRASFDGGCTKFIPVKKKGGGRYWRCAPRTAKDATRDVTRWGRKSR